MRVHLVFIRLSHIIERHLVGLDCQGAILHFSVGGVEDEAVYVSVSSLDVRGVDFRLLPAFAVEEGTRGVGLNLGGRMQRV